MVLFGIQDKIFGGAAMEEISLRVMTRELCHQLFRGWENDPGIYADMDLFRAYQ